MKAIFLLLLFLTAFARADEIGSQYRKQAEAGDARAQYYLADTGNDSNLLIVFYVQIMPDDFVMQLHRF